MNENLFNVKIMS